jgi:hypothetical protein
VNTGIGDANPEEAAQHLHKTESVDSSPRWSRCDHCDHARVELADMTSVAPAERRCRPERWLRSSRERPATSAAGSNRSAPPAYESRDEDHRDKRRPPRAHEGQQVVAVKVECAQIVQRQRNKRRVSRS